MTHDPSIQVRLAKPDDAAMLSVLARVTFRAAFGEAWGNDAVLQRYLDQSFSFAKWQRSLANPNNLIWIAEREGTPLAYAKLKRQSAMPQHDPTALAAQLQKIYVLPDCIGHGLGGQLLQTVLDWQTQENQPLLWLAVWQPNDAGVRFYQRHGFAIESQTEFGFESKRFEYHVMTHRLATPK